MRQLAMAAVAAMVLVGTAWAGEKIALDKLPKPVADAVAKRFPKAETKAASMATADGKTTYEVSLKDGAKNIDVSVTAEGTITQIEQEMTFKELPKAVAETFEKKYPKATYTIIEAVIRVKDGKEVLEYYEAVLVTADKKTFEAEVLPDGKFKGEIDKTPKKEGKPNLCGEDQKGEQKNEQKGDQKQSGQQGNQKGQNEDKDDKKDEKKGEKKKKGKKKGEDDKDEKGKNEKGEK